MLKSKFLPLALCAALSGCSFGMQAAPPGYKGEAPPRCDTGVGRPVADTVIASVFGLAALGSIAGAADPSQPASSRSSAVTGIVISSAAAGFFGWAAGTGYSRNSSCHAAQDLWAKREPEVRLKQCTARRSNLEQEARKMAADLSVAACPADRVKATCSPCMDPKQALQCTATACLREVTCDESQGGCAETQRSKELQVALDRLALETACSRDSISVLSQAEWRVGTETAFRLQACGASYVCAVGGGHASCKAALAGGQPQAAPAQAPAAPSAPPPPPAL